MLGPGEECRQGQLEAIATVTLLGARALAVQRTGWGKSLVYWIATRIRRDGGAGPTLIISPLHSLMRNQISMAERVSPLPRAPSAVSG
jgi:ATP-dependent DNA helicase RecQ